MQSKIKINRAYKVIGLCLIALLLFLSGGCRPVVQEDVVADTPTVTVTTTATATATQTVTVASPSAVTNLPTIADVVAKVKPKVVAISVKIPYYDFFGRYVGEQESAGSGWIISSDGYIVTNAHVVENASSILVTFDNGLCLPVDVESVRSDTLTDLAVLKVVCDEIPALEIGDVDTLREGDWVVAIGNSLGQGIRVTQGIISRLGVSMQDEYGNTLEGLLETDTVINPGNSGGPLVNLAGEIVGITNAKRVQTGVEGVGYAININDALPIIDQLIQHGYVSRPYMGIAGETVVNNSYARWYGLGVNSGVRITAVGPDSPASIAGIRINDVITVFNGEEMLTANQLIKSIHRLAIGQPVDVVFYRGTERMTVAVVLAESPRPD